MGQWDMERIALLAIVPGELLLVWCCYLEQSDKSLQECRALTDGFNSVL